MDPGAISWKCVPDLGNLKHILHPLTYYNQKNAKQSAECGLWHIWQALVDAHEGWIQVL